MAALERRRRRPIDPNRIDYSIFAIAKPEPRDVVKARADGRAVREGTRVKRHVLKRNGGRCFFQAVSPICHGRAVDRHEIIRRSRGGLITVENCVGACRACHDADHGEPGPGRRLMVAYRGTAPDAEAGNAWPVWLGKR